MNQIQLFGHTTGDGVVKCEMAAFAAMDPSDHNSVELDAPSHYDDFALPPA